MRAIVAIAYLLFCLVVVAMIVPDSREQIIGKSPEPVLTPDEEAKEADKHGMTVPEHRKYLRAASDNSRQNQHLAAAIVTAGALIGAGLFLGGRRREEAARQELRYEARHPRVGPPPQL